MPSVVPERADDVYSPPRPPGRRVTLDFMGPPLPLPGEGRGPADSGPPAGEGLELDTTELSEGRPKRAASAPRLDLDLGELEADGAGREQAASAEGRDGWSRERSRHSSPPPGLEAGARPTPAPPADSSALPRPAPVPEMPGAPGHDGGDALGLVDRSRASTPPADLASEMRERFALDDFTGAMRAAELLLGRSPDHAEAQRYADGSRRKLEQLYSSRLGGLEGVPLVVVRSSEVRWLGLDHRAGFLLSRIDGTSKVEDILDMSGMPRLEALKVLSELLDAGAIRIEAHPYG